MHRQAANEMSTRKSYYGRAQDTASVCNQLLVSLALISARSTRARRPDQDRIEEWSLVRRCPARQSQGQATAGSTVACMVWPAVRVRRPPVLQSKLLCLSLLYLLTTVPPALYVSFSDAGGCLRLLPPFFRPSSSSSPPTPSGRRPPLFRYPPGYGEHRHALPTPRNNLCSNPVAFADYKTAFEEIHGLRRNVNTSAASPAALRYQSGTRATFAGNFSADERRSFFSHTDGDDQVAIPCGFFREFPIPDHDRLAMERCRGIVVVSAIMNDHDKVRQPRGLGSDTLRAACFFLFIDDATRGALARHGVLPSRGGGGVAGGVDDDGEEERSATAVVGAWRVVTLGRRRSGGGGGLPYEDPAMNGVVAKHLLHRLFPNARFSVWVDGKVQLTVDPVLLVHALLVRHAGGGAADVAVSRHPFNRHTLEEAVATARWRKCGGDVDAVRAQMETYCANGLQPWSPSTLPFPSDVPDTAVIVRRHGVVASDLFSCLLFNELEAFSPRDQLAFAYVRDHMSPKVSINMFEAEVFEQIAVEYRHNLKPAGGGGGGGGRGKQKQQRMASSGDIAGSSCERYLQKMWGESAD